MSNRCRRCAVAPSRPPHSLLLNNPKISLSSLLFVLWALVPIHSPRGERTQRVRRETGRPPGAAEPLGAGLRDHWQLVSRKWYIHHFTEFTMYGRVSAKDLLVWIPLLEPQERPYGDSVRVTPIRGFLPLRSLVM